MKAPSKVRITFYLLGFAGAALFTGLLIREGAVQVGSAIATAGWALLAIIAYHFLVPVFLDSLAWWVLFPKPERPRLRRIYWMRWIGESVSTLVPSAAVGGDIVRARLAAIHGTPVATAAATVLVDLTLGVFTQAAFTLLGVVLLVNATGQRNFVGPAIIGTIVGIAAVGGFYFVQRRGMFGFLARMVAKLANSPEWHSLIQSGTALDEMVGSIYARRRAALACCGFTILSLILNSGEIYIALWALHLHATVANAIILQSMALTIRSVAFPVPGGIGAQESGYVLVGNLLGIPGETAFALSLIARVRELGFGIPGLFTWQLIEGRHLLGERTAVVPS
ncbi:MAG TPA: flippase-like domain-containing protein [Chthoniobacterales bacterium]|nr:flippase-like domain-containing protein [Chthoniobacterales bacterium]